MGILAGNYVDVLKLVPPFPCALSMVSFLACRNYIQTVLENDDLFVLCSASQFWLEILTSDQLIAQIIRCILT